MPLNLCSGFLIQPRLAVSAAHCVFGRAAADLRVVIGASISAPQQTIDVAGITIYPRFKGLSADAREANDLAVLTLSVDANGLPIAYDRDVTETGQAMAEVVGFGLSDPNDSSTSGTRRAVIVRTTTVCDRLTSFGDGAISACIGDSGGPLLASDSSFTVKAVAIVSFGSDAQCGAPVYALRLAPFAAWLDTVIAGHADSQCSSSCAPAQTSCLPGPPPDSQAGCRVALTGDPSGTSSMLLFVMTLWLLRRVPRPS